MPRPANVFTLVSTLVFGSCLLSPSPSARAAQPPQPGSLVDLAAYGCVTLEEKLLTVEWTDPREVHEVRLVFPEGSTPPPPDALHVAWWGHHWPDLGSGGWARMDDHWNGKWVRAAGTAAIDAQTGHWVFRFDPLSKQEWNRALDDNAYPDRKPPAFRTTLKLRVNFGDTTPPPGTQLQAFNVSRRREGSFNLYLHLTSQSPSAGRVEVANGELLGMTGPADGSVSITPPTWKANAHAGDAAHIRLRVAYADTPDDRANNDFTRVTVRLGDAADATGFSFIPQDVPPADAMRLPDLGVLITPGDSSLTFANDPGPPDAFWDHTVRERVALRPEMTRAAAMVGIPRLRRTREAPLGVPSARQEIFVTGFGDWAMWHSSLHTEAGDSRKCLFRPAKGERTNRGNLEAVLDTRAEPAFDGADRQAATRRLEDDHLPLIHAEWHTGPIRFHHALTTTVLVGDIADESTRAGDETVVLLTRLDVTNTADKPQAATVNLRFNHDAPLELTDAGLIAIKPPPDAAVPEGLTPTRGMITADIPTPGEFALLPATAPNTSQIIRWRADLAPHQSRALYFKAPFVDLLDADELARLKDIRYDDEAPRVLRFWRQRLAAAMRLHLPDPALENFYRASLWHNLISADRDPATGLYNMNVGTVGYKVFANETVMIARAMDLRGEHADAERYLEPMLHFQGREALTGRFSTTDGVLHSAGAYTHGQYAMNHGFTLWGVADHYLLTRDRAYLERVAPQLVKGCDFLINERRSTLTPHGDARSRVHGLAPASSLEDVIEFKYWFATNSYFYLGMKRVADALADVDHPDAARLADAAEAYRADIETALREATTHAAAVRLRDGSFVPYVPPRVFESRHFRGGWIREALYSALDAAVARVIAPDDPLTSWVLDDLEDNLYFSGAAGYGVLRVDDNWFALGGGTKQPCLVDAPILYMARDEIPASLRAFWNTYALLIYPDIQCFAEWAPDFGEGGGPLYKTSDESRFTMWIRQLLLWEDGDVLWLARGTPREWLADGKTLRADRAPTHFGDVTFEIRSDVDKGFIRATVELPTRRPPREVWLRLRHPDAKRPTSVYVNDRPIDPEHVRGEDVLIAPDAGESPGTVNVLAIYSKN